VTHASSSDYKEGNAGAIPKGFNEEIACHWELPTE